MCKRKETWIHWGPSPAAQVYALTRDQTCILLVWTTPNHLAKVTGRGTFQNSHRAAVCATACVSCPLCFLPLLCPQDSWTYSEGAGENDQVPGELSFDFDLCVVVCSITVVLITFSDFYLLKSVLKD